MEKYIKYILCFFIGGLFFSVISVYAALNYQAYQIIYGNTTLDHTLDSLYSSANTTITNLENDLNTCNNKSFVVRDIVTVNNYTQHHINDMAVVHGSFRYFKIINNSKGNNAVCSIYTTNGASNKINDLSFGVDYSTTYNNVTDYRLNLTATTSWCSYTITFHN